MIFTNKTIWITGASSGIGRSVALKFSEENTKLILSDINEAGLIEVAKACEKNGCTTVIAPMDLSDEKSVAVAAQKVLDLHIKIDCLYQFAGISQRSLVSETPMFVDRKIFEINFFGAIALTKAVLPEMIKNGGGQLAVTSSLVGKFGFPYRSSYSATKHALTWFFRKFACRKQTKQYSGFYIYSGPCKNEYFSKCYYKRRKNPWKNGCRTRYGNFT